MEWWVFPALIVCAVAFVAGVVVLLVLAVRGVWRLLARYEPAHALPANGERWVPWETDPRFGSMQLADDVGWSYRSTSGVSYPVALPPLDWREVAHEGDWYAQTAADLAPAVLDSGPGDSLAPGPDLASGESAGVVPRHGGESVPGGQPEPDPDELPGLHEWHDHAPLKWDDEGVAGCPSCEQHWECPPEPVHTVAGRLVETSDEWLRRLVADARKVLVPADELPGDWPGWTWAGTVAA